MDKTGKWTFEGFSPRLDKLDSRIREKAIEIANGLLETEDISEAAAIEQGIVRAEQWFYDLEA
ncbi:hypothetical protein SAMN05421636_105401 [Pricia antarctica]|uniref:Uncharacterized protein n=1 Tax=Pricia antarctica TaxID=641691 RepID=A0A1G7DNH5_9FLAO|nr:hypothetical protein [Pricia antarctica]SDE53042.1 hypothetical protein SAMN05421636_105401 [Pricia antarctica]